MSKELHIVEFPWQIDSARAAVMRGGAVAVAGNYMMHYAMTRQGIPCKALTDYYQHNEFWPLYEQALALTDGLVDQCSTALGIIDDRFGPNGIRVVEYHGLCIKINIDQLLTASFQLQRVIATERPECVVVAANRTLAFDNSHLFAQDQSMFGYLADQIGAEYGVRFEVQDEPPPSSHTRSELEATRFTFGQPRIERFANRFQGVIRRGMKYIQRPLNKLRAGHNALRVLSINGKDIEAMSPSLARQGIHVTAFHENSIATAGKSDYPRLERLLRDIGNCPCPATPQNIPIPFDDVLPRMMQRISTELERAFRTFTHMKRILRDGCYDVVIVQTLSPFNMTSIMANEAARRLDKPVVCWMHGGYGAYYSLPGFDVTDYRFTTNHVLYGQAAETALTDRCSPLKMLYPDVRYNLHKGGSPYFEQAYANYRRPHNAKPVVVFTIGCYYAYNHFYFGYNRPNTEFRNWDSHQKVIEVLAEFQDRYDIIIKDYPHSETSTTWRQLIADLGNKMSYVSFERSYEDTIRPADVLVYSWVSTSLFEGLQTNADILLHDDSDLTPQASRVLNDTIVFSTDIDVFVGKLRDYLEAGNFGEQDRCPLNSFLLSDSNAKETAQYLKALG